MIETAPSQFALTSVRNNGHAVLGLAGELDMATEEQVRLGFNRVAAGEPSAIVMDLRELTFIDVAGMHALIGVRDLCVDSGRRFFIVRGSDTVQRLLALCHLEDAFETVVDPEKLPAH